MSGIETVTEDKANRCQDLDGKVTTRLVIATPKSESGHRKRIPRLN